VIFFFGAPNPAWLTRATEPQFVAMTTLADRVTMPRRIQREDGTPAPLAIDGGVFHTMSSRGELPFTLEAYAALARRVCAEIGGVVRVAALDLMCEPPILAMSRWAKGLSRREGVRRHQQETVHNLKALRELAPEVPWMPALQGWEHEEYFDHLAMYAEAGVDLLAEGLVGLGSVCRRQNTRMAEGLVRELVGKGLSLHLLGFKVEGLARFADLLGDVYETDLAPRVYGVGRVASYDTQADLLAARSQKLLHPTCAARLRTTNKGHQNCASCLTYALHVRALRLAQLDAATRGRAFLVPRHLGCERNRVALARAAEKVAARPRRQLNLFAAGVRA